jgi:hypothetical protein
MADKRSEYEVEIGGLKHTLLLTEDDAKNLGNQATKKAGSAKALAEESSKATSAYNKAFTDASNK